MRVNAAYLSLLCIENVYDRALLHRHSLRYAGRDELSPESSSPLRFLTATLCQPLSDLLECERPTDEISLGHVTPPFFKQIQAFLVFHAFSRDFQTHVMAEIDSGSHDGGIIRILRHFSDERLVDFQLVYGQLFQVRQ